MSLLAAFLISTTGCTFPFHPISPTLHDKQKVKLQYKRICLVELYLRNGMRLVVPSVQNHIKVEEKRFTFVVNIATTIVVVIIIIIITIVPNKSTVSVRETQQ